MVSVGFLFGLGLLSGIISLYMSSTKPVPSKRQGVVPLTWDLSNPGVTTPGGQFNYIPVTAKPEQYEGDNKYIHA